MVVWNPHKLAGDGVTVALELATGDRCRAKVDLPGVPAGTPGVVEMANGFVWLRYQVRFDNGVVLRHLDGRHLEAAPDQRRHGRHTRLGRRRRNPGRG